MRLPFVPWYGQPSLPFCTSEVALTTYPRLTYLTYLRGRRLTNDISSNDWSLRPVRYKDRLGGRMPMVFVSGLLGNLPLVSHLIRLALDLLTRASSSERHLYCRTNLHHLVFFSTQNSSFLSARSIASPENSAAFGSSLRLRTLTKAGGVKKLLIMKQTFLEYWNSAPEFQMWTRSVRSKKGRSSRAWHL